MKNLKVRVTLVNISNKSEGKMRCEVWDLLIWKNKSMFIVNCWWSSMKSWCWILLKKIRSNKRKKHYPFSPQQFQWRNEEHNCASSRTIGNPLCKSWWGHLWSRWQRRRLQIRKQSRYDSYAMIWNQRKRTGMMLDMWRRTKICNWQVKSWSKRVSQAVERTEDETPKWVQGAWDAHATGHWHQ